jgi:uncharacterized membrane protein
MARNVFISQSLSYGWATMKKNLGFFILLIIVMGLIQGIPSGLVNALQKQNPGLAALVNIGAVVLQLIVSMGLIRILLNVFDSGKAEIGDLFSAVNFFFYYLGGAILYGLIVFGGLLLLIVPGIIWSIKFQFFGYFIIDKGMGPIEALKASARITQGVKWELFAFGLLLSLINLAGLLCLVVGVFATIPTTWMASVFVYRHLLATADTPAIPETV